MTHHPHVHMIVPGGGISPDGDRWIATKPNFFLPVFVLSRLFRRLMLEKLAAAHASGKLVFFGAHAHLVCAKAFAKFLAPAAKKKWFVYAKEPFAGPKQVLAYLSRYTHRVAISNSRLIKADDTSLTFRVKNYRANGPARYTTMTLDIDDFIRRFLLHVLPKGFHRIRHAACPGQVGLPTRAGGLLATGQREKNIERARDLLGVAMPADAPADAAAADDIVGHDLPSCPCCGSRDNQGENQRQSG